MSIYPPTLQNLIDEFAKLPGIGPKSAQRIAFFLLGRDEDEVENLAVSITDARNKLGFCMTCFNLSDTGECSICSDNRRDHALLCVVEEPRDVVAMEKTKDFRGRYHVLGGALSPLNGIGPDKIRMAELFERVRQGAVQEIIIATNPNLEGEATAMYISKQIKPLGIRVTKLASGLPVGGDIEFADEVTLSRALEGRREL